MPETQNKNQDNIVTGFRKMCIVYTSNFAHLEIIKTTDNGLKIWRNSGYTHPENFTSIYHFKFILWVTKFEKLDVWTKHVFPNLVTI